MLQKVKLAGSQSLALCLLLPQPCSHPAPILTMAPGRRPALELRVSPARSRARSKPISPLQPRKQVFPRSQLCLGKKNGRKSHLKGLRQQEPRE